MSILVDMFSVLRQARVAHIGVLNADFSRSLRTGDPSQPSTPLHSSFSLETLDGS